MNKYYAIMGIVLYVLLNSIPVFWIVPYLGLLALPVFLVMIVFSLVFLFNLPLYKNSRKWLAGSLMAVGLVVMISAAIFAQSLYPAARVQFNPSFEDIGIFTLVSLVGMIILLCGIKERTSWEFVKLVYFLLVAIAGAPLVIITSKLLLVSGLPLSD